MAFRIEIGFKQSVPDARGKSVVERARHALGISLQQCRTRDVYKVDIELNGVQRTAVRKAFTDPVTCSSAEDRLAPPKFTWLIEIGYKPGVTDNVGRTARSLVRDVLDRDLNDHERVFTAIQYFITAPDATRDEMQHLASDLLANPLIQDIHLFSQEEWDTSEPDRSVPLMAADKEIEVNTIDLNVDDESLMRISREGILSLSLQEMHAIRDHYLDAGRKEDRLALGLPEHPTDVELECIAQTWSEHCKHKIFAGRIEYTDEKGNEQTIQSLFKTYIQGATKKVSEKIDWLVSVFSDNAGVIRFRDDLYLVFKVETHNSPSALDPYGGSITGIVGCNRDPMGTGLGAELLCNTWGYCLGSPFYDGDLPEGLFHPRRIRDGVHAGVIDGGNQSGIPYVRGFECFDDRFIGKPLVYCGTAGFLPAKVCDRPSESKEIFPGDILVVVGGRTGLDGIHGATFSSEELRQESPAQAVQIGDPITQRMMYEFLIEARDLNLYQCITDNGAGGLSCSAGEMGTMSGGVDIDLQKAPLKYEGLQPWEILLSEAQERMTLAVPPEKLDAFMELARRREVEAAALGTFTDNGKYLIRYGDRVVASMDMSFLYEHCPLMTMEAKWEPPHVAAPKSSSSGGRTKALTKLLGRLNVCSKEFKSRMYDHEVKGRSIVKPFVGVERDVPGDATVLLADYKTREGVVLSDGINPFYSDLDTYHMTTSVVDVAVRRIISAGGNWDHIAILDNFCWPDPVLSPTNPDGPYKLAQLVRSNQALYDITTAYSVPLISGKDSMKNDSVRGGRKISIPPTLLISAIGKMDDIGYAQTLSFKNAGDVVYILGNTAAEMGASEYHRMLAEEQGTPGDFGGTVPSVDLEQALGTYKRLNEAIRNGLVSSCHTPTTGGLGVGLALCVMGGNLGATIDLSALPAAGSLTLDQMLFSETNSRFILTCTPETQQQLEASLNGLPLAKVGTVDSGDTLTVLNKNGRTVIQMPVKKIRKAFTEPLKGI